jgi:cell wall-associated NlpC family hydrolase
MTNAFGAARRTPALCISLVVLALAAALTLLPASARAEVPGGVASSTPEPELPTPTGPPGKAMLVNGRAIPPANAPAAVKKVIAAANKIRTKPYIYGGGHGRWWDAGYDCSGAVSFALHGGSLIPSPMPSGSLVGWGEAGRGRWITVYANGGHAYAVIAGLRWDTAGNTSGTGPRWHKSLGAAATGPFTTRHPTGY